MNGNGANMGTGSQIAPSGPGPQPGNRPQHPGASQGQRMPDPRGHMV